MPHLLRMNAFVSNPQKMNTETQISEINLSMSTHRVVRYPTTTEPPQKFWEWVKRIDANGDGRVSRKELEEALRKLGFRFCFLKAWSAIAKADANGDGYISGERELREIFYYIHDKLGITFV
ncbi:probable calcium-binding protein CML15 [Macadamia integrifolia]|uniref:probable calcium-binding protein CML15 n=1 Tax=Macadamia integrifolia TaxID=60698 RepID=UPI001C4F3FF3|nr:probable calcium-binding protein CML15 [Macadamia integrifolia]